MDIFKSHPASVGETYVEHLGSACGFGAAMLIGGIACLVHGLVPALFVKTGSRTVQKLHQKMVSNRRGKSVPSGVAIDYVI